MRRIKEALHLSLDKGLNQSQVSLALRLARSTVQDYLRRADLAGLAKESLPSLTELDLEKLLFPPKAGHPARPEPDVENLHAELRKPGVTLQLLWEEYRKNHADGLGYTQFCERYRTHARKLSPSMRQVHKGGEKAFVDYSGKKPRLADPKSGGAKEVELFVMVWGASNFIYAEAQESQTLPNWLGGHARAFQAFGCVPYYIVPDCLKAAVTKAHLYDPDHNETYVEMCRHYGCAPLPARPYHPKDKSKVEVGVQVVQRWILARLRHHVFYTLDALNTAIASLCKELNDRMMRHLGRTRAEMFAELDKPHALAHPPEAFRYYTFKSCRVGVDYCIQVERHYYSVPYIHIGKQVTVRLFERSLEILLDGERIALHVRSRKPYAHTILPEHMPEKHRKHLSWTPARLLSWAQKVGPNTRALIAAILERGAFVEMGYRPALGVMRLADAHGAEKLEAACTYALPRRLLRVAQLTALLKMGVPGEGALEEVSSVAHENLRGMGYYAGGET